MVDEKKLEKDIEAIESEKEKYLEEHPEEESEDKEEEIEEEVDVETEQTEFSLTEDEIDEWIVKLTELKVEKKPIELEIDDENTLKINFEMSSEEDSEEDGE